MKKPALLITFGIVLLIAGGYFAFHALKKNPVKAWDLVPSDAMIVYEKDDCAECITDARRTTLWKIVEKAAFYKKPIDSIKNKIDDALAKSNGGLVSVHLTRKDEFDFVYYLPLGEQFIPASLTVNKKYSFKNRLLNGVTINELRSGSMLFSYAKIEEIWIGSFTPFLIEDVIRTAKSDDAVGRKGFLGGSQFTSIKDDAGNLYIKIQKLNELLSIFVKDLSQEDFSLGKSALLDVKTGENSLVLNGFSTDSVDHSRYSLSIFQHQSPVSFGLKGLIPNRAVAVKSYGISDGKSFAGDLQKFVSSKRAHLRDSLNQLSERFKLDLNNLPAQVSDEIAVCFFEASQNMSSVALIETTQPAAWTKSFDKIAKQLSIDTVFYERYGQYEIREIPFYGFTEKLLWPLVRGFQHNYYTVIGKVIAIAEDAEELKQFLDDIEADDTWGKSVSQNQFLETTLLESNVSLYVNQLRFWNQISSKLQPRWQSFYKDNRSLLHALKMSSFQLSHLNNSYYTNAIFTYRQVSESPVENTSDSKRTITSFQNGIQSLHAVRSHVNRSNEILIQDSVNNLSLVSADGKVLWQIALGYKINSEVTQLDFFNNGKLQYFFSTPHALHVIDRLGNYVQPFPLALDGIDIDYVNVIDYDNSKKYRLLMSDKDGKIRMYDKDGQNLEGWQPNDAGGQLAMAPRHYRIKGKDYIIAVQKNGIVNLWTRRGEIIRKFPLNLEVQPIGDVFLERGTTLDNTFFVLVTRDGFRLRFTPEGKIQSKETLLKNSVRSTFALIPEKDDKGYIVFQQDERQVYLADVDGKKILSSNIAGILPSDITYFDFGAGRKYITIVDRTQGFAYVYDDQGNLITSPPVESSMLQVRPAGDQVILFFAQNRQLVIQPL